MEFFRRLETKLRTILGKDLEFRQQLMREQPTSVWCLDFLKLEDDKIQLDGWALPPPGARPALKVNGVKFSSDFGIPRPDLERVMSFDSRAPSAGFRSEHSGLTEFLAGQQDTLEIQFCDEATLQPFNVGHSFYWPLHPTGFDFPDEERRKRVHGGSNLDGFVINGYSIFKKLSTELMKVYRPWESFSKILDWGCGCSRVFRYFPPDVLTRLVGADIDQDNIAWCKRTFPNGEFHTVPLVPPTQLPSNHFDLVIGISIFTHLRDHAQHAWLEELSRITRRGGLLLVSIHGPAAAARSNLSEEQYHEWITKGFVETGLNIDLKGAISDDSYYVDTLHRHAYVRREWGKYFHLLKIQPAYIANHQDLVVMRKR